jgi:hypothetical protein
MGMDMRTRKPVVNETAERYRRTRKKDKGRLLDEFVALTGYNRCYAARVLRGTENQRYRLRGRSLRGGKRMFTSGHSAGILAIEIEVLERRVHDDNSNHVPQPLGHSDCVEGLGTYMAYTARRRRECAGDSSRYRFVSRWRHSSARQRHLQWIRQ